MLPGLAALSIIRQGRDGRIMIEMDGHDIIVGIRIHEVLIDQRAGGDDTGHPASVHQPTRLDLARDVVGKLLGDGYMAIQVLDEDLEEAIQLVKGEACLQGEKINTSGLDLTLNSREIPRQIIIIFASKAKQSRAEQSRAE